MTQLDKKTEEFNNLRILHEESRTECVKLKTNLQELEDRFFHSKVREREAVDGQLKVREEIYFFATKIT